MGCLQKLTNLLPAVELSVTTVEDAVSSLRAKPSALHESTTMHIKEIWNLFVKLHHVRRLIHVRLLICSSLSTDHDRIGIRCDGEFPCNQCNIAALSCKRDHVPKRRGPKRGSGRVINELRAQDGDEGQRQPQSAPGSHSTGPPS